MTDFPISLQPVDRVEVITLIDNYVDALLPDTDIVTRPALDREDEILDNTLLAEHGLSLLITVRRGAEAHTILFDSGYTRVGVLHNVECLSVDLSTVEAVVLSHAHMDHTGGLMSILDKLDRPIPLFVHPEAFHSPRLVVKKGKRRRFPLMVTREGLSSRNVRIVETREPTLMAHDLIAVTGEVERHVDFEKGMPDATLERDGETLPDLIRDDQSLVIHLRGRGLVVITGCSHSGIVNTVAFAEKITGLREVHAVMGGFHLTASDPDSVIEQTIDSLLMRTPRVIVPMHCTGWKAVNRFSEVFPDAFIPNSVGSRYELT